jgi:agmatinase
MVLQGILYDDKSSYLKGPALAPPLIRKAYSSPSANYFSESGLEIHPDLWEDKGDFAIGNYFEIEEITAKNLRPSIPLVTLGGDHSITYPIVKAFNKVYGPVDLLHIDAHADLYDEFEGDAHSHACPFARIMENHLAGRLVQVGLRTLSSHQREQAAKFGVEMIEMKDFDPSLLPTFKNPIYLSVDIDALDPAYAAGVSHYEPGGLSTRQLIDLLQRLDVPILGADIVEYNPLNDSHQMTAMVCAKILKEIAALMIQNGQK